MGVSSKIVMTLLVLNRATRCQVTLNNLLNRAIICLLQVIQEDRQDPVEEVLLLVMEEVLLREITQDHHNNLIDTDLLLVDRRLDLVDHLDGSNHLPHRIISHSNK